MFREDIERLIEAAAPDSTEGAKLVCQFLENELELAGNGWFDNDPILNALFSETDDPAVEAASEELFERVEAILSPQEV
jgi:hypothetical protein